MTKSTRPNLQKGFSLIELLIVILLVSMIYVLGFSPLSITEKQAKPLTPLNLKKSILNSKFFTGESTFMCTNKCKKCYFKKGSNGTFNTFKSKINLKGIEVYSLNESDSVIRVKYERYNDEKICLVINFYNNGSSTQLIIKNKTDVYFLPGYFGEAKKFDSVSDAQDYWVEKSKLVKDSGSYY